MKRSLGLWVFLALTSCSHEIFREDWLYCCRVCKSPGSLSHVEKGLFSDEVTCNCENGDKISLIYK